MKKKILFLIIPSLLLFILFSVNLEGSSKPSTSTPRTHFQPNSTAINPTTLTAIGGKGKLSSLGVNFYFNPSIVDNNYQLKNGDTVCVGDTDITLKSALNGEWFSKGGPIDSPPITFVTDEQFKTIVSSITSYNQNHQLPTEVFLNETSSDFLKNIMGRGLGWKNFPKVSESDPNVTGIPLDLYLANNGLIKWSTTAYVGKTFLVTMICTGDVKISGISSETNSFKVMQEGSLDAIFDIQPSCAFYIDREITMFHGKNSTLLYSLFILNSNSINENPDIITAFKMASLTYELHLNAVSQLQGAQLQIVDKSSTTDDKTTIMLSIQNTGDSNAILDDITSSIPLTITYKPPVIKPDTTEKVFLQTSQQVDLNSLQFHLSYRSETLSCQPPTTTTTTTTQPPMQITSCSSNSQCSTGLCCQNQCRDSTKGVCRDINGDGILEWVPYEQ